MLAACSAHGSASGQRHVSARGAVVIDWRNMREGSPDLDAAMSGLILARGAKFPALSVPGGTLLVHEVGEYGADERKYVDQE